MTHQQLDRSAVLPQLGVDDTDCNILHVDMDAFFASVELRDRPDLVGRPVIVGGASGRGVVTSATYEARRFGVHSAMPMSRAMRLCPQAEVVGVDHAKYAHASKSVMAVLAQFTPELEVVSVDEAFLDVGSVQRSQGGALEIARTIRTRLDRELDLPSSIGIGTTTSVAKIASTLSKPNGLMLVPAAQTVEFLQALPVQRLWGVGGATARALDSIGVAVVADLVTIPPSALAAAVGKANASRLVALARGQEVRGLSPHRGERSLGAERTFDVDVDDVETVRTKAREETQTVLRRLRHAGLVARTVTVKLRFEDFRTIERSHSLQAATATAGPINEVVDLLLDDMWRDGSRARLVGVRLSGLSEVEAVGQQMTLDEARSDVREIDRVADEVVDRYGTSALRPASLLPPVRHRGDS